MPRITAGQIEFLPEDRQILKEQSVGILSSSYISLFNSAINEGDTTKYFKFLEEIAEKDPDINHSLSTRTSYITSKEWQIEGDNASEAKAIEDYMRAIKGDPFNGLVDVDRLIETMLGPSYLTGLSISEVVTDDDGIIGFNYIPTHFLTFNDSVHYPKLFTQETPTGVEFNREKMISHFLKEGSDRVRGYLGNAIGWLYVFKRAALEAKQQFQRKYGKGFLLINMPGDKDTYLKAWETAEELISNYSNVDGAVFPAEVIVDFKEANGADGSYFFTAEDSFKSSITKVILGQESTSSSQDSNRSTADVHMEVLEQRILEDSKAIESTLTGQLIPMIKEVLNISEDTKYEFKFIVSDMEATLDDEMDTEVTEDDDTPGETANTEVVDD